MIILIFLSIYTSRAQITYFPDTSKALDVIFPSQASNNFIYNAGYFSSASTKLYINKQGIELKPFHYSNFVRKLEN